jgi:hypothetical protein
MTMSMKSLFAAAATLVAVSSPALQPAFAAEPVNHSGRTITYRGDVKVEKVGDVEGHIRGTFTRAGLTLHETGPRAGQVSEIVIEGDFDMIKGLGAYQAKMFRTFADGDTVTLQIDGESKPKGVGVGTYRCIEGTGGMAGVQCQGTYERQGFKNKMTVVDWKGTIIPPGS